MNPHQRCLQAKVKYRNDPKQVMPKCENLRRSLEIKPIWTFDTEFPTIFNRLLDLTACQPIWVMLCRNELCQKLWKKYVNNIILFVEATVNMMKCKVC